MTGRTNWRLVLLLWAAGLGAAAQYGKISVVFDRLPQVYPEAGTALGFAVSLVGALGIVLGIVAGVLVSQIGYRRAILWALIAGALMSALQAFFPPLPVFLATRVVEGATHLALVVALPTFIAQISSDADRGVTMTLWGTFFGVAFAVLAWAGLPLVDRWGIASLMGAHAMFMAAMAGILWRALPRIAPDQTPDAGHRDVMRAHLRLYGSARIGAPALGWLFYTICFVSVLTVMPAYLPEGSRAFTVGAMPLMSILSSLTLGVWLMRRSSPVTVIVTGFAACAGAAIGLWLLPGSVALALALGAALGLVQGATFAAVPELNTPIEDRALANGGLAQMGNLGNTSGTPLMVALIAGWGYGGMMTALVALFIGGALVHLWLAARRLESR